MAVSGYLQWGQSVERWTQMTSKGESAGSTLSVVQGTVMVKSYCIFIPEWVVAGLPREYMPLQTMHDNTSEALTCRGQSEAEVVASRLLHAHHKSDTGNMLTFGLGQS